MRFGRQADQKRTDIRVDSRFQLSPMSSRNRRTAIAILATHRLYFTTGGAVIAHWLPHTAGMGRGSGDRHGHRDKRAHEQQHKQQSGGQAIHDGYENQPLAPRIGDTRPLCKYPPVTGVQAHVGPDALVRPAEQSSANFLASLARPPGRGRPGLRKSKRFMGLHSQGYRSNTQRPPSVKMMTKFMITNIRS